MQNDPLVEAKLALARGDMAQASVLLAGLMATRGDDPEVLYLAAVIARARGDFDAAHRLLDQLMTLQPQLGRAHQERGHCFRQQGQRDAAIAAYEQAVECNPLLTASIKLLAVHYQQADPVRAKALQDRLDDVEGHPPEVLAALSAYYDQDYTLAEARVRAFLLKVPDEPVAMRLLAELGTRLGEYEDAELILSKCKQFSPDYLHARFDYAEVLSKRFKYDAALREAEELLALEPANPQFLMQRANLMLHTGRTEDAAAQYALLQQSSPDNATVSLTYGHALKTLSRIDEAVAAYRQAYAVRSDFGDAYWSLANLKTYRFTAAEMAAMAAEEAREGIAVDDRIHLCFALGKALEDAQDHARSFEYYQRGNQLRQGVVGYRPKAITAEFDRQIQHCNAALFSGTVGAGCPADDPIFILGLPRAGSTLLEQILASHSQVEGTTELPDIMAIASRLNGRLGQDDADRYPDNLGELSRDQLAELGQGYIDSTRVHRTEGKVRFIDKMPNNFRHIGLIHLILPNARIIDARREPLACGFSVFKQLFAAGQDFSYDLGHIGRYYADYLRLMAHWDAVLPPGRVLKVQHEDVLDDLEGQVRRILDYCALPFEPACLEFHKTSRAVRTPSSEQVRRPINRDGTDVWKAYDPWLGPLKQALAARPELPG
ncbi:MAG: sulfotransferase [Novosphingobium sp.]|uniref:tetratricopeptide repeat-containing sulfotransferase family protein n=1 Tax=Novosphingobium sp. TaxID=1874826 RepID=UPI0032BDBBC0